MKRGFIVSLLFLFSVSLFAQERKFEKLIEKYDVIGFLNYNTSDRSPKTFWNAVWQNNESYNKFFKAVQKKGGLISDALCDIEEAKLPTEMMVSKLIMQDKLQFVVDSVVERMELKKIYSGITAKVFYADYPNAFAIPDGRIFITDSLLCLKDFNYDIRFLEGVFAHEFAHFLLQHTYQRAYAVRKKLRTNQIVAGVTAAVEAASTAYAQANGAADDKTWDSVNDNIKNLSKVAYEDAFGRFKYKYTREQEIEADIVAYRFLEWVGIGGKFYIGVLKSLGTQDDIYYTKESDHPKMEFRIQLLEYLSNKDINKK